MNPEDGPHAAHRTVFRSRWVLIGFLLVIAYFLFTEHRAHVIPFPLSRRGAFAGGDVRLAR
ncbi:DUF2933 domain-containing protein [Ralstonia mannitolilytica]|uniref:DUF2933 domain-containing protein n=1 Tax=Ralstonia mannitolilytica TaxID=105219 RepID=UPI002931BB2B|nr:DUF2933 domain-containing protein [Ralstonia mannitolilytica]